MLSGHLPFGATDRQRILANIRQRKYEWPAGSLVSEEAKEVVFKMLAPPQDRWTLDDISTLPFFSNGVYADCEHSQYESCGFRCLGPGSDSDRAIYEARCERVGIGYQETGHPWPSTENEEQINQIRKSNTLISVPWRWSC
jgi:hypothetical protein